MTVQWKDFGLKSTIEPREPQESYPLSFSQQRLWFLEQLFPDSPFNNIPYVVLIKGILDEVVLTKVLNTLVKRHESLRTVFFSENGLPRQKVISDLEIVLEKINLMQLEESDKWARGQSILQEKAAAPFDLTKAPLFQAVLITLSQDCRLFFLCLHHLIADGWSLGIIQTELTKLYNDYTSGLLVSELNPMRIQYLDFSEWQRQQIHTNNYLKQLNYWKDKLKDLPKQLSLPYDYPENPDKNRKGSRYYFHIPQDLVHKLSSFAKNSKATLYVLLMAALKVLLYRYTQENDIAIACPIANRHYWGSQHIVGFFVNTLVIRSVIQEQQSFKSFLDSVKHNLFQAYENQDLPFEHLVKELQPERDMSMSPLFKIGFVFHNTPKNQASLNGLNVEPIPLFNGISLLNLLLSLTEINGALQGFFEYPIALFERKTMAHLTSHYLTLLQSISEDMETAIDQVNLLSDKEKKELAAITTLKKSYEIKGTIPDYFEKVVEDNAEAIALSFEGQHLSYRELNNRANQLAHFLVDKRSIRHGSFVGIYMQPSFDLIIAILAVLKCGATYLPFDTGWPNKRIEEMCKNLPLDLILSQNALQDKLPKGPPQQLVHDCLPLDAYPQENLKHVLSITALAYIIHTSGSTGLPKGVQISHHNILRLLMAAQEEFAFQAQEVWTLFHSVAFDFSVWEIFAALLFGGKLVIVPYMLSRSPKDFLKLLIQERVTVLNQTPSAFKPLLKVLCEEKQQHTLRYIIFGGEKLDPFMLNPWFSQSPKGQTKLINMYGITETTVHVSFKEIDNDFIKKEKSIIGKPLNDLTVHVLDKKMKPCGFNIIGEMYIEGAGLSCGYYKKAEWTKAAFLPNPERPECLLYKTGDLAYYTLDGELVYFKRADQQVKIRGFRIELGEIESLIKKHPQIKDVIIYPREDSEGNKFLVCYYIKQEDENKDILAQEKKINQQWTSIFNQIYAQSFSQYEKGCNLAGWNSLYTGLPIPKAEMQSWVDTTIERILLLKPKRVLEIGCGTGLLLFRLYNHCEHYMGVDPSKEAIEGLKSFFKHNQAVDLQQGSADQINALVETKFDFIVINSVVQYFPSLSYLKAVIDKAIQLMPHSGTLFIGDVRNLCLLPVFYKDLEQTLAGGALDEYTLDKVIQARMDEEHELIIDPEFFYQLQKEDPKIDVTVLLKKGIYTNELTRFRYDVIIKVNQQQGIKEDYVAIDFNEGLTKALIGQKMRENKNIPLLIHDYPNPRMKQFSAAEENDFSWFDQNDYYYEPYWPQSGNISTVDLLFCKKEQTIPSLVRRKLAGKSFQSLSNNPTRVSYLASLNNDLRAFVSSQLPEYMVPTFYICLPSFPLTINGKINTQDLPNPGKARPALNNNYVAPKKPLEKQLSGIWTSLLGINQIGIHDNFFDLGGHSLLATQLLFKINETFNIDVPLRVLFEISTIAWLAKSIEMIKAGGQNLQGLEYDFYQDGKISFPIRKMKLGIINRSKTAAILLTGVTGFFGAFILRTLILNTQSTIFCLIRAQNQRDAWARLIDSLKRYGINIDGFESRIVILIGDLTKPNLGLDGDFYQELIHTIDIVYHNGSMVHFISAYANHKAANVYGTGEIIQFCNRGKTKILHYISTTHVFTEQDAVNGVLYEDTYPSHPKKLTMGYTQSKWVAEEMIRHAAKQGLPAYIYRLGRIFGDSQSGLGQKNDFLWLILQSCIALKMAPKINFLVDVIPADCASNALFILSQNQSAFGSSFHLVHPEPISWDQLINLIKAQGFALKMVSYKVWYEALKHYSMTVPNAEINRIMPLINKEWHAEQIINLKVDCQKSIQILKQEKWFCASIDLSLINKYFTA